MKHNQKTSEQEIVDFIESINLGDYPKKVLIKKVRTVFKNENEELQQLNGFVLTKEDHLNIQKWQTATTMVIQTKMRTPYSQSELDTSEKLKQIVGIHLINKDEVLGETT